MLLPVDEAAAQLKAGQVIAYPTEAVWGLGCDPFNATAFAKILQLKRRPIEKGVILLASDLSQVAALLAPLNAAQRNLVEQSWLSPSTDRATTWLLPHQAQIPNWITGQHPLVAVRVTTHPLCQALCRAFQGFIVSTSANVSGLAPAQTLQQTQAYFANDVAYLAGELGDCQQPSRIINALTGEIVRA